MAGALGFCSPRRAQLTIQLHNSTNRSLINQSFILERVNRYLKGINLGALYFIHAHTTEHIKIALTTSCTTNGNRHHLLLRRYYKRTNQTP